MSTCLTTRPLLCTLSQPTPPTPPRLRSGVRYAFPLSNSAPLVQWKNVEHGRLFSHSNIQANTVLQLAPCLKGGTRIILKTSTHKTVTLDVGAGDTIRIETAETQPHAQAAMTPPPPPQAIPRTFAGEWVPFAQYERWWPAGGPPSDGRWRPAGSRKADQ